MNVNAPENFFLGLGREFRESPLKIAHAHAPQPMKAPVDSKCKAIGHETRHCPRHAAQNASYGPNQPVLQIFLHH
jgi:hypothetical protein